GSELRDIVEASTGVPLIVPGTTAGRRPPRMPAAEATRGSDSTRGSEPTRGSDPTMSADTSATN
ncbi:MAG: hypothetical protein NTY25_05545, partial [Planctomycetia bacterium]|nr:hypothetical protein [Planctomycetia bacterium]